MNHIITQDELTRLKNDDELIIRNELFGCTGDGVYKWVRVVTDLSSIKPLTYFVVSSHGIPYHITFDLQDAVDAYNEL